MPLQQKPCALLCATTQSVILANLTLQLCVSIYHSFRSFPLIFTNICPLNSTAMIRKTKPHKRGRKDCVSCPLKHDIRLFFRDQRKFSISWPRWNPHTHCMLFWLKCKRIEVYLKSSSEVRFKELACQYLFLRKC